VGVLNDRNCSLRTVAGTQHSVARPKHVPRFLRQIDVGQEMSQGTKRLALGSPRPSELVNRLAAFSLGSRQLINQIQPADRESAADDDAPLLWIPNPLLEVL
jgi:hypothetical protein